MSDLMKDPMILRSIIMDHYEYPRNHELTKEDGYAIWNSMSRMQIR